MARYSIAVWSYFQLIDFTATWRGFSVVFLVFDVGFLQKWPALASGGCYSHFPHWSHLQVELRTRALCSVPGSWTMQARDGTSRDISVEWEQASPGGSNITVPTSNDRWGTALLRPCAPAGSPSDTQGLEDVGRLWDAWNGLASLRVSWAIKKPWGLVEPLNKPGWLVGIGTYTT